MKNQTRCLNLCALLLVLCTTAYPQQSESRTRKTLRITGRVTTVLAKATARATFEAAKFAGKNIVVPAIRNVAVPIAKATPPLMAKSAKLTAMGIKNGFKAMNRDDNGYKTSDQNADGSTH